MTLRAAARWSGLLGAVVLAAACRPTRADLPEQARPWFVEEAEPRGIGFTWHSGAVPGRYLMPEIMGGGAALFDMDEDGDLDAYLVQAGSVDPGGRLPNQLYENTGGGRFLDRSAGSGAEDPSAYGMGVACGDVDCDGDTDLYVTNLGRNTLLVNEGGGRFRDGTVAAGAGDPGWSTSAAFFDLDRDGYLDLYVANYLVWAPNHELRCFNGSGSDDYCSPRVYESPAADVLYHNRRDGSFVDCSAVAGVAAERGTGLGVVAGDFDGDGWCDVFVANDGMPNRLWINRRDGTFADEAVLRGCDRDADAVAKAGMGVAAEDLDDDGDLDLLVCNLAGETDSVYVNDGPLFSDRTAAAGLAVHTRPFTRFGMGLVDFDQDGRLDLYQANGRVQRLHPVHAADPYAEPNVLLRGVAPQGFLPVRPRGGTMPELIACSRAAAFGDVDGDGAVDVLVVNRDAPAHLLMNRAARGSWIAFHVVDARGCDAIGARVSLDLDGRRVRREVRAAYSYLASSSVLAHFGLGDAARAEGVVVEWSDGSRQEFGAFAAGQVVRLQQGP